MRSRWKNAYVNSAVWALFRSVDGPVKKKGKRIQVVNSSRSTTILPVMNSSVFLVHNGRKLRPVQVTPSMFGTKLGEYVRTKEICVFRRRKNKKKKNKAQKKKQKTKSK